MAIKYISVPTKEAALAAYSWGYRANQDGDMIDPEGRKVHTYAVCGASGGTYLGVNLYGAGYLFSVRTHHLQAIGLYGEAAFMDAEATRHRDGDHSNNRPGNIIFGARRGRPPQGGKATPKARLNAEEQESARELVLKRGMSYSEAASQLGVHRTTIMRQIKAYQKAKG